MLILDRLACWIDDLGFLFIVCQTDFDYMSVLGYVALRREQKVDWSCNDLEEPFFL